MRRFLLLGWVVCASAQQVPFTLDQVLGAAFPTELTAAPSGGKVAWVSNARGVRNILVAEPPSYQARRVTTYNSDDGQEISGLRWTPDASALVYVRGGTANPALDPKGVSQDIWVAELSGAPPRKIAAGSEPAISPNGGRLAFASGGQIYSARLDGTTPAAILFHSRGTAHAPEWSPDGARVSFVSNRGDHSFIGVYDVAASALRYLDPSTDDDSEPAWSPDSRSIVFLREPSTGKRAVREARRAGEPWSIRMASAATGEGRELWRAQTGPGSVFRGVTAQHQLQWTADSRIVFPWEADGWTHLYSVAAAGSAPVLLTPGEFEVEDAALSASGREVIYSSNQNDIDRRHIWRVATAGGPATAITSGETIEWAPAPTSDENAIALLQSDAQRPVHPVVRVGTALHDMDPASLPADFPLRQMVTPRQVVFPSTDGLTLHGQLFLPPNRSGPAPALVFFHGGSRRQMLLGWHSMYYYSNAYAMNQYLANAGYVVLSVNYRSGIGYGLNFREALNYGPSGGSEYNDVQAAGLFLRARPEVNGERIGAWGGSYGGYLTAMALARASNLFKAGVDFHGVHDWAVELGIPAGAPDYRVAFESSPMNFLSTWTSPVLLIQGDDDPDVLFNNTVMLADALRRRNVEVEELIFPDEVHDFLLYRSWRDAYQATVRFLDRKLKR
ncbi:MAG TPA: prolyl oligopeptidase family serine peptidase [Candidatus Sulfopaludibacter sp.]|jgi:dipeptidyl aminopeptidase/acylaminoacyl peptidase|nr:prolyl oligopeptidase family serine peptidase [Candidatus Sulfopaludibacter sp.]